MKVNALLPVTQVLAALGRPVFYYPLIGRALRNNDAAVFLGNFMYWEGKQADKSEGFIFKNSNEIFHETGLKRSRQESARKVLCKLGILEEKKEGYPPKIYYRFNWEALDKVLSDFVNTDDKDIENDEIIGSDTAPNNKEQKTSETKKPKDLPPTEEIEKPVAILYQMKVLFDKAYEKIPGFEMGYQWSKDIKGGMDWKNLKMLKNGFIERAITRKRKEFENSNRPLPKEIDISDEELLTSWEIFLDQLPAYHSERNFTPALLYKNFNIIVKDIVNANKTKQQPVNAGAKSTARTTGKDYV